MTTQLPRTQRHAVPSSTASGRSVVGYDGSSSASVALQWAAQRARRCGTPLVVLSAADYLHAAHGELDVVPQLAEDAWRAVEGVAAEGVALAAAAGADASALSVLSDAASALVDASAGAESVVVARRGAAGGSSARVGRVAFSVVDAATSPVVLVRGEPHLPGPDHPVVVGLDGSASSQRALRFAASEAAAAAAPLVLVSSWQPPRDDLPGTTVPHRAGVLQAAAEREAQGRVRAADAVVREVAPAVRLERRLVVGPADLVLAEAAQGAGLLVVGGRGDAEPRGGRLGGTTQALLSSAPCAVAVVR